MDGIYDTNTHKSGQSLMTFSDDYVVIDLETTGLSPSFCEIIELSGVRFRNNALVDTFSSLIKPQAPIPELIQNLTGITDKMVETAPSLETILPQFLEFIGDDIIVGHNVTFDIRFLQYSCNNILNVDFNNDYIDTLRLSRKYIKDTENHKLSTLAQHFGITPEAAHRALADCITTNDIYSNLQKIALEKENDLIAQFKDAGHILDNKTVVFKGSPSFLSLSSYKTICQNAGGTFSTTFFADKTDYIVFAKHTYNKYLRGDYSSKMEKAMRLAQEGKLEILSEEDFFSMFNVDTSQFIHQKKHFHRSNIKVDIKSMSAENNDFDETHPLFDKVCVFTGALDKMSRKDAMQCVLNLGGKIADNVTKKTNYLILGCNDFCKSIKDGKSSKHKKAEDYMLKGFDIQIMDEDIFYALLEDVPIPNEVSRLSLNDADKILDTIRDRFSKLFPGTNIRDYIQTKILKGEKAISVIFLDNKLMMKFIFLKDKCRLLIGANYKDIIYEGLDAYTMPSYSGFICIDAEDISLLKSLDNFYKKFYEDCSSKDIGCCSHYEECSDAGHCVNTDIETVISCAYRQNLNAGKIFYGKNKNI